MTLKIGIVGAGGRMGRNLIQSVHQFEGVELTAAFERAGSSLIGADAGELVGLGNLGVAIKATLAENPNFDLLIDFTRPEGTLEHIAFCVTNHKKMVIGTTGFDDAGKQAIKAAAEKISITQEELAEELRAIAIEEDEDPEEFVETLEEEDVENIADQLTMDKTMAFILDSVIYDR